MRGGRAVLLLDIFELIGDIPDIFDAIIVAK
jgi:hypothetical protein